MTEEDLNQTVKPLPVYNGIIKPRWDDLGRDTGISGFGNCAREGDVHQFFRKPLLAIEFDKDDTNTFTPSLELISTDNRPTGIIRYYLKVRVRNIGDAIATRCRAKLNVIRSKPSTRHPSDTKLLCWDSEPSRFVDIGADDDELLQIVFTDSDFKGKHATGGIDMYALASTIESLYPKGNFIRAQDAFGIGEFDIRIVVRDEGGNYAKAAYKLNIKEPDTPFTLELVSYDSSLNLVSRIRSKFKRHKKQ